jgi:AcrR family transcriptional regulator
MAGDLPLEERRTRGGWTPVGTAANRRAKHELRITSRGEVRRRQIIESARAVFESKGYFDANIEDIVEHAGIARGSFYTYFPSKREVFDHIVGEVNERVIEAVAAGDEAPSRSPMDRLRLANRRYLQAYKENARIYALIEQVSMIDPAVHQLRLETRRFHVERVAASIRRWQQRGVADPSIDPLTTAGALVSMLSGYAYWLFAGGDEYDEDVAVDSLNGIWARAIQMQV